MEKQSPFKRRNTTRQTGRKSSQEKEVSEELTLIVLAFSTAIIIVDSAENEPERNFFRLVF